MSKRITGTMAEVNATIALNNKALGLPAEGVEVGPGPHVSNVPQKRSLGMVDTLDIEGNVVGQHEAFETLHGEHVPFVTTTHDRPRKHPTKKLWDCAALSVDRAKAELTTEERAELVAKYAMAKAAGEDWEPVDAMELEPVIR